MNADIHVLARLAAADTGLTISRIRPSPNSPVRPSTRVADIREWQQRYACDELRDDDPPPAAQPSAYMLVRRGVCVRCGYVGGVVPCAGHPGVRRALARVLRPTVSSTGARFKADFRCSRPFANEVPVNKIASGRLCVRPSGPGQKGEDL